MQIRRNCNLEKLLSTIQECQGKVNFETPEGDVLVMKSTLCQYIFLSLEAQPELLYSGIIKCDVSSDYDLLREFLL